MAGKLCLIVECVSECSYLPPSLSYSLSLYSVYSLTKTVNRLGILIWNANNKHQMKRHRKHRQENAVKTFKLTSPLQCVWVCMAFIKRSHKWQKGHTNTSRETHILAHKRRRAQHVHKDKDHNVPINRKSLRVFFFSLFTRLTCPGNGNWRRAQQKQY